MRLVWGGALVLAAALAAGQPAAAAAAGEARGRGSGRSGRPAARDARGDEDDRLERAIEAADRAGVDGRDIRDLQDLCRRGRFAEEQSLRIFSLAAQLALEGLPVESFAAKVGEGVSKRIDPDRIVEVAERRALMLNRARSILNDIVLEGAPVHDRDELIPDVAQALEAGSTEGKVRLELQEAFTEGESMGAIRQRIFP
ncbi:MAG TPA: hypothetical protein VI078_04395 [bacterium]